MRELESEEKREGRNVFVERKGRRVMENVRGEGDKKNEEEKQQLVTVGENE